MGPIEIATADLERTATNLERLAAYLAARCAWTLDPGGTGAIQEMASAANRLARVTSPLVREDGLPLAAFASQAAEPAPTRGHLDTERLRRFADFVDELERWFALRASSEPPASGSAALHRIDGALRSLAATLVALGAPPTQPAFAGVFSTAEGNGGTPVDHEPATLRPSARLVLVETTETPLLQQFHRKTELTFEARERIDAFFAETGVELSASERIRFETKLIRWIEATPAGQALVLKVSGLQGRLEPYPGYAQR